MLIDRWAGRVYVLVLGGAAGLIGPFGWVWRALRGEDLEAAGPLWRLSLEASIGLVLFFGVHGALWGAGWIVRRGRAWLRARFCGAVARNAQGGREVHWRSFLERWGGWRAVAISGFIIFSIVAEPELPQPHLDPFEKRPVRLPVEDAWIDGDDLWVAVFLHLASLVLGMVFGLIVSWRATVWALGQIAVMILALFWTWIRTDLLDRCRTRTTEPCGLVENLMAMFGLWP